MSITVGLRATLAVLLLASGPALAEDPSDARQATAFLGPLGLTATSSARLNFLTEEAVRVDLLFLDARGTTVADSGPLTLTAGQATSLTLSGASLTYAPGALRAQVEARVQLLSSPGHALAFATLELLDPDSTVLVLYPSGPVRALATTTLTFGPLALSSGDSIGIAVANLSSVSEPKDSVKAVLSFFSLEGTLLKQEEVTVAPEHTATLSMSGAAFSGEVIGQVRFDPSTALTVSSLQLFDTTTQTTKVDLYPTGPLFPSGPVFPSSP